MSTTWLSELPLGAPYLIGVLAAVAVVFVGVALILLGRLRRETVIARKRAAGLWADHEDARSSRVAESLQSVGQAVTSGKTSRGLQLRLQRAGYQSQAAPTIFLGAKVLLLVLGLSLAALAGLTLGLRPHLVLCAGLLGGLGCYLVPDLVVATRRSRRRSEMQRRLPDAVDLLEICVSSGMGLDMAWQAVAEEVNRVSPMLADEMELTRLEINLGVPRSTAMKHMAERTGVEDISSMVALLIQADRFGASIVDALRVFASTMREIQGKRAEESAEKMSVRLLFPMVLFIFPTLLIVMVGPAVMRIVEYMG